MNNVTYELSGRVVSVAVEKFTAGEYEEVYVFSTVFVPLSGRCSLYESFCR